MFPRYPLSQLSSALVTASVLALVSAAGASAGANSFAPSTPPDTHDETAIGLSALPEALGLRTDRLTAKQRERWRSVVRLVFAADDLGRPLHPTLRRMWEQVAASGHEVYIELPEPRRSARRTAGLFRIETVRPDGHILAMVRLNLETIDRAIVADAAHGGFRRFHELEREERYAEVLGHELGHAVWTLADPERARQALTLRSRPLELARSLLRAQPDERAEIHNHLNELGALAEAQEVPARAAEAMVWRELVASQAARGVQTVSSSRPKAATGSPRLPAE